MNKMPGAHHDGLCNEGNHGACMICGRSVGPDIRGWRQRAEALGLCLRWIIERHHDTYHQHIGGVWKDCQEGTCQRAALTIQNEHIQAKYISDLEEALESCLNVLDSESMNGAMTMLSIRGMPWSGPSVDVKKLRTLIIK